MTSSVAVGLQAWQPWVRRDLTRLLRSDTLILAGYVYLLALFIFSECTFRTVDSVVQFYFTNTDIELKISNSKWLLSPIYKPPCQKEAYFLDEIQKVVDFCAKSVQNLLLFGDFNMDTTNNTLSSFIDSNGLFSMIRTPTCFKSTHGRCIDLMLTNKNTV